MLCCCTVLLLHVLLGRARLGTAAPLRIRCPPRGPTIILLASEMLASKQAILLSLQQLHIAVCLMLHPTAAMQFAIAASFYRCDHIAASCCWMLLHLGKKMWLLVRSTRWCCFQ